MIKINSFGVAVDMGLIPPMQKGLKSKAASFGVAVDMGIIPPKNFFHSKVRSFGVAVEVGQQNEKAILFYQIY